MSSYVYDKYRQTAMSPSGSSGTAIDLGSASLKLAAVSNSYTPNAATDQFWSSVSAYLLGTAEVVTVTSTAAGLLKFTSPNIPGIVSATAQRLVLYQDTGTAGTSQLIAQFDGTFLVTAAATATNGATTVTVDPLLYNLATGAVLTFNSGGSAVLTLTAPASAGARSITVSGTWGGTGNLAAGNVATGVISGNGLPFVAGSSAIALVITPDATNGFFKL